ncbi:MAG: hypothetical protein NT027_02375 [Proteobacteria bacterium]|nr:hypothetical protein [Pseudomonadota bacterium]
MKIAVLPLLLSSSLIASCGMLKKSKNNDDGAQDSSPAPTDQPSGNESTPNPANSGSGTTTSTQPSGTTTSSSSIPTISNATLSTLPTAASVSAYAKKLKPKFDSIVAKASTDIGSTDEAATVIYYELRTSRQLMALLLDIKTFEKTGKTIDFAKINDEADKSLIGSNFSPLYKANESGMINLLARYSSAVNKSQYLTGVASGAARTGGFLDVEDALPNAVYWSTLALKEAVKAELGLSTNTTFDMSLKNYSNSSMNVGKLYHIISARAQIALSLLEQVDPAAATIERQKSAEALKEATSLYHSAEVSSRLEKRSLKKLIEFYLK